MLTCPALFANGSIFYCVFSYDCLIECIFTTPAPEFWPHFNCSLFRGLKSGLNGSNTEMIYRTYEKYEGHVIRTIVS